LISVNTSEPRRIGDPSGADDAISVEMITEADLQRRSDVSEKAGGAPAAASVASPPTPPVPETPAEAKAEPPPPEPEPVPEPETKAEAVPEPAPKPEDAIKPALAEEVAEPLPLPGLEPAKKTADAEAAAKPPPKPQPKPAPKPPQKKTAALDFTPPSQNSVQTFTGGGGSAGFERPPGITRSGANDAFARDVIRALKKTMPQLSNTFGRVTVRIILNQNGNMTDVKVLKPSDVAGLDQNVIFATQQTSYPFPPPASKDVDRVFVVTYIYR